MNQPLCKAQGCARLIAPVMLMCPAHWKLVPAELKRELAAHYVKGQEHDPSKVTEFWKRAAWAAIQAVHEIEQSQMKSAGVAG